MGPDMSKVYRDYSISSEQLARAWTNEDAIAYARHVAQEMGHHLDMDGRPMGIISAGGMKHQCWEHHEEDDIQAIQREYGLGMEANLRIEYRCGHWALWPERDINMHLCPSCESHIIGDREDWYREHGYFGDIPDPIDNVWELI